MDAVVALGAQPAHTMPAASPVAGIAVPVDLSALGGSPASAGGAARDAQSAAAVPQPVPSSASPPAGSQSTAAGSRLSPATDLVVRAAAVAQPAAVSSPALEILPLSLPLHQPGLPAAATPFGSSAAVPGALRLASNKAEAPGKQACLKHRSGNHQCCLGLDALRRE